MVGFGQAEIGADGENCMAITLQKALMFDMVKLAALKPAIIHSAFLVLNEREAPACPLVLDTVRRTCWQSGVGCPEHKPQGCVLVKVPSIQWVNDQTQRGEMPTNEKVPEIHRLAPGRYDVTTALRWQQFGAPLGVSPGHGFLLQGHVPYGRLTAQDNTICISQVSDIRLEVNFTRNTGAQPPTLR